MAWKRGLLVGVWGTPSEFSSDKAAELAHRCVDCAESRSILRKSSRGQNMVTERHQKQPQMRGIGSNEAASRIETSVVGVVLHLARLLHAFSFYFGNIVHSPRNEPHHTPSSRVAAGALSRTRPSPRPASNPQHRPSCRPSATLSRPALAAVHVVQYFCACLVVKSSPSSDARLHFPGSGPIVAKEKRRHGVPLLS